MTRFNCQNTFFILLSIADINECLTLGCKANATCDNYDGFYNCTCDQGYQNNPSGGPKDFDCIGKEFWLIHQQHILQIQEYPLFLVGGRKEDLKVSK